MWNYLNYFLDFIHPPIKSMKVLIFFPPNFVFVFQHKNVREIRHLFTFGGLMSNQIHEQFYKFFVKIENWEFKLKCQLIYSQELTTENFERAFWLLVSRWKSAESASILNKISHFHSKIQNFEQIGIFFKRKNLIWLHNKQKWNREQVQKSVHKTWRIQIQVHK